MPSRMEELLSSYFSSSSSHVPANSLYVCSLCLQYLKLFFSLKQYSLSKISLCWTPHLQSTYLPRFFQGEWFHCHTRVTHKAPSALSCSLLPCPALPLLLTDLQTQELSQLGATRGVPAGTAAGKGEERRGVCIALRIKVGRGGRAGTDIGGWGGKEKFAGASFQILLLLNWRKHNRTQE